MEERGQRERTVGRGHGERTMRREDKGRGDNMEERRGQRGKVR